jgi:DNA-binding NarL/FixJ family response regulator
VVKVLVVDDSSVVRSRLVAMMSEVPGVEVGEACSAEEALEVVRRTAPGVVLLDLRLPGKSGLAVLRDLKAVSPSPVVIVLTSHPTEHHRRSCLAQGADFFFDKSADFARVVQTIVCPTRGRPLPDA